MKFSILPIIATLLAATTSAAPNTIPEIRATEPSVNLDTVTFDNFNQTQVFTFAPQAACNILKCIDIIGDAICIVNAIRKGDVAGVLRCADRKALCGCAGCIDELDDFLTSFGVC